MFKILVFAIFFSTAVSKTLVERDDGCEECTKHVDTVLSNFAKEKPQEDLLQKVNVKGIGTCSNCELTGVKVFHRVQDQPSCVTKSKSDQITSMTFEFPNITAQCTCKFGDNPIESFLKLIETAGDPVVSMCTLPHMAKNMKSIHFVPEKFPPDEIHVLEECFSQLADLTVQPLGNFKVGLNFENTKYSIDIVASNGKKKVIENTKILIDSSKGWKHKCEGSEKIMKMCQCAFETSYIGLVR